MPINFSFVSFRQNSIHRIAPVLLLWGSLFFFGYNNASEAGSQTSRYEFKGVVKAVNRAKRQATIKHEEVKDLMSGMTMPFLIKDAKALQQLRPGDQITATLVVTDNGATWLENVTIIASTAAKGQARVEGRNAAFQ